MRAFSCRVCGQLVFFENSECLRCGTALGFLASDRELHSLAPTGDGSAFTLIVDADDGPAGPDEPRYRRCDNESLAVCNWLVPDDPRPVPTDGAPPELALCECCTLTRTRPSDDDLDALAAFADTEAAKRRLVFQLLELGLPVVPERDDPERGLSFDLLSSRYHPVTIGHEDGLITLDLSESDDAHREQVREELGEPYRTMLGHLRHEIGHYYWQLLVEPDAELLERFRTLFGDERQDYGAALGSHYGDDGPPGAVDDWQLEHVSSYATMHPWEDWAETFAHELHILDTLQTAAAFGMVVTGPAVTPPELADDLAAEPLAEPDAESFDHVVDEWLPLTYALNALNRSMGKGDLYPFVLPPAVLDKLAFVHEVVQRTEPGVAPATTDLASAAPG